MTRRKRILLLTAAVVLLGIALALNYRLGHLGVRAKICNALNEFGYDFEYSDIYVTGSTRDVNIRELLTDVDLTAAIAASKQAGFPSDVDRVGEVAVLLARVSDTKVITIYTVDGSMELCFIQVLESEAVEPL